MTYKQALFFVAQCLTINYKQHNKDLIEKLLKSNKIDWEAIVKVSTAYFVFPTLYCNLLQASFLKYVPEDLVVYMKYITQLNRERNSKIIEQAKEIQDVLIKNSITPIFLKGTGNLLEGLYKDIGERMVGDIDIIVVHKDFNKTVSILQNHGYTSEDNSSKDFHWHYPGLIHPNKIACIEVHKKILKDDYQDQLKLNLFNKTKIIGTNINVLTPQNKFLATVLPKIINDNLYYSKTIPLRTAYDIFLLSRITKVDITTIKDRKIKRKLNNYISCIKFILPNSITIKTTEDESALRYKNSYQKLLEKHILETKKMEFVNYIINQKDRVIILKKSFYNKTYRKYLFKRLSKKEFYELLFGMKKSV